MYNIAKKNLNFRLRRATPHIKFHWGKNINQEGGRGQKYEFQIWYTPLFFTYVLANLGQIHPFFLLFMLFFSTAYFRYPFLKEAVLFKNNFVCNFSIKSIISTI